MCGRFALTATPEKIKAQFELSELPELIPQYNIAPSLAVLAIVEAGSKPHAVLFRWGLIPFWAADKKIGNSLNNARAETVTAKPAFRRAFKSRRCLMVMSGFFEWQDQGGLKQPFYIKNKNEELLAVAGLWESWQSADGQEVIHSCCLITTQANSLLDLVHHRMPVILDKEGQNKWLNPKTSIEEALKLLKPCCENELDLYPVSVKVNSSRYLGFDTINPM
ncbi:MAG: SOS response-associated peptidase [Tatlockia sp.]|nr:SOS response-associated peptidase [Tatlockia sp.]